MPSFRRRTTVPSDGAGEDMASGHLSDPDLARTLAEEAEAEAAEAEARAAAAKARARALRLRREAEQAQRTADRPATTALDIIDEATETLPEAGDESAADDSAASDVRSDTVAGAPSPRPGRRLRWTVLAASLVIVATLALIGLSGFFLYQHRQAEKLRQQAAEYAAAGRQSVITLMSLDFSKAQDDVQRIIDNSTGSFKDDFQSQAKDFVKVAQDSKVVTEVTVSSSAVERMDEHSAVVLVAASSRVSNAAGAKQEPRSWRLSVDLQREGDQIKMSKVEFVP
ncbi:hypothetical protein SBI67_17030 [Mycolicibacterium sp. 120266]|uniref:hypothetical protein n=1 Tax=Mycolicibacterium sp. 120266 TaxID=3090601 RepID=UPI00299DC8E6|nr:hypothetical protein [Mycolicibacterium sp. 120266]MDX1873826.1 hypothetical protein [Mycolicibacterium sp. 120266]